MVHLDFNQGLKLKDAEYSLYEEFNLHDYHSLISLGDAKIKGTSQVMYLTFTLNNHKVLLLYKYVKMMKTQYVRLLHTPITRPRNIDLENRILSVLSKHEQVQEIITDDKDLIDHNISIPTNFDRYATDFYDVLDSELLGKVNKGKRRSKIKYTKYKDRISFRKATQDDYLDIMHIMNTWMQNKSNNNDLFNKKTFNTVKKKFDLLLQDPFSVYITLFDDHIVAFEVFYLEGSTLFQLVNQAIPNPCDLFWDDITNREVHAYCLKWHHLQSILEFINNSNIRTINYEYASKFGGGLYTFKDMLYSQNYPLIRMKFKKI